MLRLGSTFDKLPSHVCYCCCLLISSHCYSRYASYCFGFLRFVLFLVFPGLLITLHIVVIILIVPSISYSYSLLLSEGVLFTLAHLSPLHFLVHFVMLLLMFYLIILIVILPLLVLLLLLLMVVALFVLFWSVKKKRQWWIWRKGFWEKRKSKSLKNSRTMACGGFRKTQTKTNKKGRVRWGGAQRPSPEDSHQYWFSFCFFLLSFFFLFFFIFSFFFFLFISSSSHYSPSYFYICLLLCLLLLFFLILFIIIFFLLFWFCFFLIYFFFCFFFSLCLFLLTPSSDLLRVPVFPHLLPYPYVVAFHPLWFCVSALSLRLDREKKKEQTNPSKEKTWKRK